MFPSMHVARTSDAVCFCDPFGLCTPPPFHVLWGWLVRLHIRMPVGNLARLSLDCVPYSLSPAVQVAIIHILRHTLPALSLRPPVTSASHRGRWRAQLTHSATSPVPIIDHKGHQVQLTCAITARPAHSHSTYLNRPYIYTHNARLSTVHGKLER